MEIFLHGISRSLHILSAVTWIGSMMFNWYGVSPALKLVDRRRSFALGGMANSKFSPLTWASLIILIITGTWAILDNKESFTPLFVQPAGVLLMIKLVLVAVLVVVLFLQVYTYAPRMKKLIDPATPKNQENEIMINQQAATNHALFFWYLITGVTVVVLGAFLAVLLG